MSDLIANLGPYGTADKYKLVEILHFNAPGWPIPALWLTRGYMGTVPCLVGDIYLALSHDATLRLDLTSCTI